MTGGEWKTKMACLLSEQVASVNEISRSIGGDSSRPPPPTLSRSIPPPQPAALSKTAEPKTSSTCTASSVGVSQDSALEKLSHSIEKWSAKLATLMLEQNQILERANELQRERFKIEQERLRVLKKSL